MTRKGYREPEGTL